MRAWAGPFLLFRFFVFTLLAGCNASSQPPDVPAQNGDARQMHFAGFEHDGFVERLVFPAVAFANENSQQHRFVRNLHINCLSVN